MIDDRVALLLDLDPKGTRDFPILERTQALLEATMRKLNTEFEDQLLHPLTMANMLVTSAPFLPVMKAWESIAST